MAHFTDAALIARVLAGNDRNAYGELVRRYQSPVRLLLRRLCGGDTVRADELAQDTFVKAYNALRSYRGAAQFPTWLYRIAYNIFISSGRRPATVEYRADVDDVDPRQQSNHGERALARHDLEKATAGLSRDERMALILSYGYNLSHGDVAAVLNLPLGTVKSHIARGRAKMRDNLGVHEQKESS